MIQEFVRRAVGGGFKLKLMATCSQTSQNVVSSYAVSNDCFSIFTSLPALTGQVLFLVYM